MIDLQKYEVGDALRCACGNLLQRENTSAAESRTGTMDVVITCPRCGLQFILVLPQQMEAADANKA